MGSYYLDIIKNIFPKGYNFAFAYGSGVFRQLHHVKTKKTMIDFILAVDDPIDWHQKNMEKNPKHYSWLKYFGAEQISKIQENYGAKIYYNTLIPTDFGLIKYGVISKSNLITDLLDWDTLYVSGRLHKPVFFLHKDNDSKIAAALKRNLFSAVHTALLFLPEEFTEQQLYLTIAGISYCGDFRMLVGENPNKVQDIVSAQMTEFRDLYSAIIQDLRDHVFVDVSRAYGQQDVTHSAKYFHLSMLPKRLQVEIMTEWNKDHRSRDLEDVLRAAAVDPYSGDIISRGLQKIVQSSSLTQGLKGILTAGATKSIHYSLAKVKKMWEVKR